MQSEEDLILLDRMQLAFDLAVAEKGRGECEEYPELFADYESAGSAAVKEAKAKCGACLLLNQCRDLAEVRRPNWGVWAGRAWKDGRLVGKARPEPKPAFIIIAVE